MRLRKQLWWQLGKGLLHDSVENRACCRDADFSTSLWRLMGLSCSQVMQEGLLTFVFFKRPTMVLLRRCLCPRVHGSWSSNGTSALALRQGEVLTMVKVNLGPEHRSKLRLSPLQISEFFRCSSCSVKSVLAGTLLPGTATLIMNSIQSRVSTLRLLGLPCFSSSSQLTLGTGWRRHVSNNPQDPWDGQVSKPDLSPDTKRQNSRQRPLT